MFGESYQLIIMHYLSVKRPYYTYPCKSIAETFAGVRMSMECYIVAWYMLSFVLG